MAGVVLKDVYKIYENGFNAVKDFNLEIKDKEFMVFVGPSGCGKSTTLRMIAGLEDISKGDMYIGDKLVNDLAPKDRDIAMVFQNYALYPHMSVYDNMAFGLKLRKVPKNEIDEKVRNAAKILDIEHLLDRKPKALSGGQRQRVAMGRAIVRNPQVFLMDEPLSNLDAKLRVQMRIEISKLYKELNTTFIYVTHDQTEAMTLGTRIVVMKDGEIQQVATPTEIYNNPVNMFVAGFIGNPQMNFLYGNAEFKGEQAYINIDNKIIELSKERSEKLKKVKKDNLDLIIGIRPEKILYMPEDMNRENILKFEGTVELTENLGGEMYIHVKVGERSIVIKAQGNVEKAIGEKLEIAFDINDIHAFNKETQVTIF
ncbi:sn-glycerol-3-phosphate ABC transporter ATP-binding protein UgpC [Clostridium sp.]|uniref:ABC transporter ATP-binding protein n=1 Tax=Clostridium sp. TaxID=1506 RepID=UPI002A918FBA|nr:sn-glycerol-3-phosphate ABC transporter ATP-binding protein UgpC [Clostridium sp.]MDY6013170.1 sn-glycerol-3-phosphate ABC transporter ATP-binding protein UgpC [Clostridium sp.]